MAQSYIWMTFKEAKNSNFFSGGESPAPKSCTSSMGCTTGTGTTVPAF